MLNGYKQILDFLMCAVQIIIVTIENRVSHRGDKNLKPFFYDHSTFVRVKVVFKDFNRLPFLLLTNGMLNFTL